jgi:hypothetical protein
LYTTQTTQTTTTSATPDAHTIRASTPPSFPLLQFINQYQHTQGEESYAQRVHKEANDIVNKLTADQTIPPNKLTEGKVIHSLSMHSNSSK